MLDRFLLQRLRAGDDGKTFLIGMHGDGVAFAVAAPLRGDQDHPSFLTFARYLVHHRFACDTHALMLPATVDDQPVYVVETDDGETAQSWLLAADGRRRARPPGDRLIGALRQRPSGLPGIQRREMDRLFEDLRLSCKLHEGGHEQ